jgi:2-succinyl-6-hydroxy-2,4-cyclohexadiene-1-carboxylate synthase
MTIQFHYKLQGSRTQPVALFLHGFLGNCHEFDAIALPYCRLSVDLPGHGQTYATDYTMEATAIALLDLLDSLNISHANLIGYSMGGRLALYLALHYPHRFPKAVLESASPGLKTQAERIARLERDRALATQLEANFPEFLTQWYEQPLFASFRQHPSFAHILAQRSQQSPSALAQSLREMSIGNQPNLWQKLSEYQQPLRLIVGERDRKFVEINQEMATICRSAELVIVSKLGHNIHFEDSLLFQSLLRDFL